MLTWLKNKLAERQHRAEQRVRAHGFEYAAAELLANGEAAAEEIEADIAHAQINGYDGPFEEGAMNAVQLYRLQRCPEAELLNLLRDHPGTWHAMPDYRSACTCSMCEWVRRRDAVLARYRHTAP